MAETVPLFQTREQDPVPPGARARHWKYVQDFYVYEAICQKAHPSGTCTTSVRELRTAIMKNGQKKRGESSVRKSVKRLEQMRMISRRPTTKNGQRVADVYAIRPEGEWI